MISRSEQLISTSVSIVNVYMNNILMHIFCNNKYKESKSNIYNFSFSL